MRASVGPMKSAPGRVSLYRRLLPSSLLAVLAGFALVVLAHLELLDRSLAQRHRQASDLVLQQLLQLSPSDTPSAFQSKLDRIVSPGRLLWLELEDGRPYRIPKKNVTVPLAVSFPQLVGIVERRCVGRDHLMRVVAGDRHYLCSRQRLSFSGRPAAMRVVEDITSDVEHRRVVLLLMMTVACVASLITSTFQRLVYWRTLRPLDRLCLELGQIDTESLEQIRLSISDQPLELQPIVTSFNVLLDRLAAARERQQTFVDGVAHELRTPITLIRGYAQSLKHQARGGPGGTETEMECIAREAERMGRLVSELLDIAREEAGRLQLVRDPLDLDDALLVAFERLEPLASARLRLRLPQDGAPPLGLGDGERLQQCLTNLVDNALKYTPQDTVIELFCSVSAREAVVHVRDHGQGVPLAEQELIFERFVRGSSEASASGSGIGLAMVRLLMRRMGGDVRVESTPGRGADFQLVLERAELSSSVPPL